METKSTLEHPNLDGYHRVTFLLDHPGTNTSVTTDTNAPDVFERAICEAIDAYHRSWWRRPTYIRLAGNPTIVIPIHKILLFKIEPTSLHLSQHEHRT